MRFVAGVFILLISFGVACYLHFYMRRFLKLHTKIEVTRKVNLLCWLSSIILVLPLSQISSIYTLFILHFLVISLVFDLVYKLLKKHKIASKILTTGVLAFVVIGVYFAWGAYNMFHVVCNEITLYSDKISEGFSVVQVSDVHTTGMSKVEHIEKYCDEISELNPDFVVLTGDIFEESTTKEDMLKVVELFGQIKCKNGVFFSYGNHDEARYAGSPHYSSMELFNAFIANGITVLKDTSVTIGEVTIVGRNDISIDKNRLPTMFLFNENEKDNYIIVLDHQPLDLEQNAKAGVDLQLSGHTHAGQIFPLGSLVELLTGRLNYGIKKIGDFTAFTSSGFAGWGYPIKTQGRAEYVYIKVLPKQ